MNDEQSEMLRERGYNDFIGHTRQADGRCKCGESKWPHHPSLDAKQCFMGGGRHNFAFDGICQDCGNIKT